MKWNFLYQITAASRILARGYRPQIPVISVLCPQLNLLNPPPPRTKFLDTSLLEDGTDMSRSVGKTQLFNSAYYPRRAQISSILRRKSEVAHFFFFWNKDYCLFESRSTCCTVFTPPHFNFPLTARCSECTLFVRWGAEYVRVTLTPSRSLPPYSVRHSKTDPEMFMGTWSLLHFQALCYFTPCKLVNTDICEKCSASTFRDKPSKKGITNINSRRHLGSSRFYTENSIRF
jgi:hypothetical protein